VGTRAGHFPFGRLARGRFDFGPLVAAGPGGQSRVSERPAGAGAAAGHPPSTWRWTRGKFSVRLLDHQHHRGADAAVNRRPVERLSLRV
jgi:hypothetical protein